MLLEVLFSFKLCVVQFIVEAFLGDEFRVITRLDHFAVLDDEDAVSVLNGR